MADRELCSWCGALDVPYELDGMLYPGLHLCDQARLCPNCLSTWLDGKLRTITIAQQATEHRHAQEAS